ncbi:hypothetical protein DAPPUDRAFT_244819 [Daphnia pulex]|uniref:Uncharacterized protein n=1 Tax=Daphnia pulex TaxID=6669 RepID=E9GLX6_DAPPU|nr:hypothetical protein DAPPUDRAFT_244819 [Daphnia pulex]|eukprot:EFX79615.1 hypothetical protein DAPPUDRAFT_244819 [Daphnia pulex]
MNGKTGVDGAVLPTETTDASIEIVPAKTPSSSVRNSTAICESNPPSLINIPTSKFISALDVDMRITPPHAVMADVLKNLDIGGLQKILQTVQTKEENTCLRKRKFCDVDTDAEIIPTKLVKVAIDSSAETVPSKVTALSVKSLPPTSVSNSSDNPIYICTSWPSSSTSDRIAKNIQTGPQSADLTLYSPGLPMEPVIHIPAIDEDLLKKQNDLMEELNSALPAWLAVDKKKTGMSENIQGSQQ